MLKAYTRIKNAISPGIHQADLVYLLRGLSSENFSSERIDSFKGLMAWLRLAVTNPEQNPRTVRFKFLIQFLERNPEETEHLVEFIRDFTHRGLAIRLLSLTGVSENYNIISEIKERIFHRFIPIASFENDLAEIFRVVFTEVDDAQWIEDNYDLIFPPIMNLLQSHGFQSDFIVDDLRDAMIIVTSQIAAIGTHREIRRRLESTNLASSHFIKIGRSNDVLLEISHCREHLQRLKFSLEMTGVSVNLIYQMEKLDALLDRLESLFYLQMNELGQSRSKLIAQFIGGLIRDEIHQDGLREFLKEHLHLLTRKIVEHAGEKGGLYIANNQEERAKLFNAAAWAGMLAALASLFKIIIGNFHFPYVVEGFFFFINYTIIFLCMQKWHLALATKLPSYTAAALSKSFEAFKSDKKISKVVIEIQKIFKSQMIAAAGNLIWLIAICIIIDWSYYLFKGHHILPTDKAFYTIKKHNLIQSGTVFYAFLTGIILWISSIMSGVTENWLVFINTPHILKESPTLNRLMDRKRLVAFAEKLPEICGSMAGNISLAALLSIPIVIHNISGIPLDVRHVTLSSGSIIFAFNALNWDLSLWPLMLSMVLSIFVMGALNFGVSFYFATQMAALAQNIDNRHLKTILKFVLIKSKSTKPSVTESH